MPPRLLTVALPTPGVEWDLIGLSGQDGVSRLFEFNLVLRPQKPLPDLGAAIGSLLGQSVGFKLLKVDGKTYQTYHGVVSRVGVNRSGGTCWVQVVPWLWLLTRTTDCRVFTGMTLKGVLTAVFKHHGDGKFKIEVGSTLREWEYCVQYRETAFNFVSRLMEQEGWYYYFTHDNTSHTLHITDGSAKVRVCAAEVLGEADPGDGTPRIEALRDWSEIHDLRADRVTLRDYNPVEPLLDLMASHPTTKPKMGEWEIYDYPGEYGTAADAKLAAEVRWQEERAAATRVEGAGSVRTFAPGHTFGFHQASYFLTTVKHTASDTEDPQGRWYWNKFECIPAKTAFRPPRDTPKPVVQGFQTATVVGPKGAKDAKDADLYLDAHGRVKVLFHWDRRQSEGKADTKTDSTSWLRVVQPWAGSGFGTVFLPRIGQEVLVGFLEGDPDRPLIVGGVYNHTAAPPTGPGRHPLRTAIQTRTGGGETTGHELRFDDTKGKQHVLIRSTKDIATAALGASYVEVTGVNHVRVDGSDHLTIAGGRHERVGGDRFVRIGGGEHASVCGDQVFKVVGGAFVSVDQSAHTKVGKHWVLEAGEMVSIKAGGSFMTLSNAGIVIQGASVKINSGGGDPLPCTVMTVTEPTQASKFDRT